MFNVNVGYQVQGLNCGGVRLSKRNKKSVVVSGKNIMNDEAVQRYQLMLELWLKNGKAFMQSLNGEVKRVYKMVGV